MNDTAIYPELAAPPVWTDRLKRGIWPKSNVYWIGLFYMALFVIRPWEKLLPGLADVRFERVTGIMIFLLLAISYKWELRGKLTTVAVVIFAFTMWVTSRFAYRPELCDADMNAIASMTISYFVLLFIIRSPYKLYFALASYVVVMFTYISKAQWEYFVHGAAQYRMGVKRLQGIDLTFGDPNAFGSAMICTLPLVYFLYKVQKDFVRTWPSRYRKWFPRFLHAYTALVLLGIFLTRSRAAIIGLVAFSIMLSLSVGGVSKKAKRVFILMAVLVCTFFVLPSDMQGRIQTIWDKSVEQGEKHRGANKSAEDRIVGFKLGLQMFADHPITGVGVGNYKDYREQKMDGVFLDSHNLVAEILSETGLIGVGAFLLLFTSICLNIRKIRKLTKHNYHPDAQRMRLLAKCFTFILLLLLLQGVSSHNLHRYQWFWSGAFLAMAAQFVRTLPFIEEPQPNYDDEYFDATPVDQPRLASG